jgi:sulfofructose kinase
MLETNRQNEPLLVAGFGSAVIDVLMMATESIGLQRKNQINRQTIQIGGVIPTALVVLSRLGIKTELHSVVGPDIFGETLLSQLQNEHVGLANITKIPDMHTPMACVVIHNDNGQRTSFYTTGMFSTLTDLTLADSLNPNAQYLIADGHNFTLTREFIKHARENKIRVLLDLGNPKEGIEELASMADAIIIPKAYWGTLGGKNPEMIVKDFLTKGPELVVLTMEEKGCLVGTHEAVFHQPSYDVTAIDTNGAGDVFFGTFMYGLTKRWDLPKIAQFACAAAARSCTIFGKDQKIPNTEQDVFEFMNTHKIAA